jgi:lipid A disaccharide synthetase
LSVSCDAQRKQHAESDRVLATRGSVSIKLRVARNPVHVRQRYALLTLWFANHNSGAAASTLTNTAAPERAWLNATNECRWYGIQCVNP